MWVADKTVGNFIRFNFGVAKGAARELIPRPWRQAGGKVSAGIEKIPPELRIPAVAFASLALIGAYSYFRRSKATGSDDDDQENFPVARRRSEPPKQPEPEDSMLQYQMAQMQAQLAQIQRDAQRAEQQKLAQKQQPASPAPIVVPDSKPQSPAVIINKNYYYNSAPPATREAIPAKQAKTSSTVKSEENASISLDVGYYTDGKEDDAASSTNASNQTTER